MIVILSENNKLFLCCVIDVVSLCTEPESIAPIARGINKSVLIGDPKQKFWKIFLKLF